MKRIIGVLVLAAALSSVAMALAGDSRARHDARAMSCPASCPAGSCPMSH
jgi:hypothetical protein